MLSVEDSLLLPLFALVASAQEEGGPDPTYKFSAIWQLPKLDGLYQRWDPARSYASPHVIPTLQIVAERLALELPLADPILIGDISRKGGGRMDGHVTHHLGIDVDIGLFMDDARQPLGGFVDVPANRLDTHATWVLVRSLLDTGQVQFILLDQSLINELREYVQEEVGLDPLAVAALFPPAEQRLSWSVRNVIRHAPKHKNHLHVRLVPPQLDGLCPAPAAADVSGPFATPVDPSV